MTTQALARLADVPAAGAGPLRCTVEGDDVGLYRVGDQVRAWRDLCPHEAAPVCRGVVAGTRLESAVGDYRFGRAQEILRCPWHGWEFDLLTGDHLAPGSGAKLRPRPVEVHDGLVYDTAGLTTDRTLVITDRVDEAERVIGLTLAAADDAPLPSWAPGAHVELELASGLRRQYSLCGDPRDRGAYRIAVLRETAGRGGSAELHEGAVEGATLTLRRLRNRFPLVVAPRYLFIAGGIGITALLAMACSVHRRGAEARLVYLGRSAAGLALREEVRALPFADVITTADQPRPDLAAAVAATDERTVVYCCGPESMIDDVVAAGARCGRRVITETFTAPSVTLSAAGPEAGRRPFELVLARSGRQLSVAEGESVLQALRRAGLGDAASSCEQGWCGSCETRVVDGVPDHRDTVLSDDERAEADRMMICVGGSATDRLSIDL